MIDIKYCGLKTVEDVQNASNAGVTSVGFVFVKNSKRYVSSAAAVCLMKAAKKAGLITVALFADPEQDEVSRVVQLTEPDVLQFHGNETAAFCEQFNRPYWKAIPMLGTESYADWVDSHPHAQAFLLDAFGGNQSGGSGKAFQWFKFPEGLSAKLILAGGLNEKNIDEALQMTGAQYIDTSSGIESSPGVKSRFKMMSLAAKIKAISTTLK